MILVQGTVARGYVTVTELYFRHIVIFCVFYASQNNISGLLTNDLLPI